MKIFATVLLARGRAGARRAELFPADGRTLTSLVHVTSPQGEVDLKVIFDKQ